jgi:hypothetical protein
MVYLSVIGSLNFRGFAGLEAIHPNLRRFFNLRRIELTNYYTKNFLAPAAEQVKIRVS